MANPYNSNLLRQDGTTAVEGGTYFSDATNQPAILRGPFSFTFATAGLTSGVTIYTPTVGDHILDIYIRILTAFNGTTPKADVGTFNGGNAGLFSELGGSTVDLTAADAAVTDNAGLTHMTTQAALSSKLISVAASGATTTLPWYLRVTTANPLLLVVSETGAKGGTATGATAGSGNVYILTQSAVSLTTP